MRFLYLDYTEEDFFARHRNTGSVDSLSYFRNFKMSIRLLKLAPFIFFGKLFYFLLNSRWRDSHSQYYLIVIPASFFAKRIINFIRKSNNHSRIVVWYWNSVAFDVPPAVFSNCACELWSFDESDCREYGLKYNSQYYFSLTNRAHQIENDVVFLGIDKGRLSQLLEIKSQLDSFGQRCYLHVVRDRDSRLTYDFKPPMEYSLYLLVVQKSKAILDLVAEGQAGLTLRPLEALTFKKKLITNNRNIARYEFYNPRNIFILGVDVPEHLPDFLGSAYDDSSPQLIEYYFFENWIQRFSQASTQSSGLAVTRESPGPYAHL